MSVSRIAEDSYSASPGMLGRDAAAVDNRKRTIKVGGRVVLEPIEILNK